MKLKAFLLVVILIVAVLCLSLLVYAASENLYKEPFNNSTFVSMSVDREEIV